MVFIQKKDTMRLIKTRAKLPKSETRVGISRHDKVLGRAMTRKDMLKYAEKIGVKKAYKKSMTTIKKYQDIGVPSFRSRIDKYYLDFPILKVYEKLRKGKALPKNYLFFDHHFILKKYRMKRIEYGNWTNQEDRFNYTCSLGLAFVDLKSILGFNDKAMGLHGLFGVSFGARGAARSLAHFEPDTWIINITRYKEDPAFKWIKSGLVINRTPKLARQLTTGGVGSFAHEYGHAIDYFAGAYIDKNSSYFSLSRGDSTSTTIDEVLARKKTPRGLMELLLKKIIWKNKDTHSSFYKRLLKTLKETSAGDYWKRRNELFARIFEQYIGYKLKQKKQYNYFLSKPKYSEDFYMKESELKGIVPTMDKLISAIRQVINK